jgi:hypothetical protein
LTVFIAETLVQLVHVVNAFYQPRFAFEKFPPGDWQKVMAWIDHPFFNSKPSADETRHAMKAFLDAVKLANGQLDEQMAKALLPR